jgi:hypothetical protein
MRRRRSPVGGSGYRASVPAFADRPLGSGCLSPAQASSYVARCHTDRFSSAINPACAALSASTFDSLKEG